jgi:PAS domain S-box-containing protein
VTGEIGLRCALGGGPLFGNRAGGKTKVSQVMNNNMTDQRFQLLTQVSPGILHFGGARMALLDIESGFWSIRRQVEALIGPRLTNSVLQQAGVNGGASFASSLFSKNDNHRSTGFRTCLQAYQAAGFGQFEIRTMDWPLGRVIIRANNTFEAWMSRKHGQSSPDPVCAYTAGVLVGFINIISNRQDVVCIERHCQAQGADACEFELIPASQASAPEQVVAFNPDPGISRQINLLEMLFDHMPMGIAVIDREFIVRRFNPTWAAFLDRYTPSRTVDIVPGENIFDLEPGTEETLTPLFKLVFNGITVRQEAVRIESGGITSYRDFVLSPLYEDDCIVGLLNVSIDATKRVKAEQRLKKTLARLAESESMLRSVIENAQHFAIYRLQVDPSNLYHGKVVLVSPSMRALIGIEDLYDFEQWFENLHPEDYPRIVEANRHSWEEGIGYNQLARFFNTKEKRWRWLQTISNPGFDPEGRLTHFDGMVIDLTDQKEAELALQESQRTLTTLISNLPGMAYRCQNDKNWTMEFVSEGSLDLTGYHPEELIESRKISYGALIHPEDQDAVWNEVQTALHENRPFRITYRINSSVGEKWVWERGQGILNPDGKVIALEGFITDITERVTAQQDLEKRVDERTRELSTLLDISHNLASTLELEPLLDLILDQLGAVVRYDAASIMILDQDILKILAYRGPIRREEALHIKFSIHKARANHEVIQQRAPVIIEDVRSEGVLESAIRETAGNELKTTYNYLRCWMGVPLIVKDQVVGMMTLDHQQPGYYASTHAELVMAFAGQAAIAIENARLYQQAEQIAIAQERNRLARDLHDAVTQTLFSASLIADVLPKLWERNPEMGIQKLEELKLLTRGALSEMRTLLLELRPDTLGDVELDDLYRHLANAFSGRTRIPVELTRDGQPALPPAVKEVFYRVAQEALNNIAKHAGASQVQIYLTGQEDMVEVTIRDDGCGFDAAKLSPENLGLKIMRERADAIHAELGIESVPGAGTRIKLYWQAREEKS